MKKLLLCLLLPACAHQLSAQDSTSLNDKTSLFSFDINYLSDNVYLGRKDSVVIPYITPGITYKHRSGLFAAASISYLPNEGRIDQFTLDAGYYFGRKGWDNGITISKSFYSSESFNIAADLNSSISASTSYDFGFIKPGLYGSVSLASKPDYSLTVSLEHSFDLLEERLSITPMVSLSASTQNYFESYTSTRKFGKGRKAKNIETTEDVVGASKFKILDYELSASVEYNFKNFQFYFTPTYAIPTNPNMVIKTVKRPILPDIVTNITEKTENQFYWTLGVTYDLKLKRKSG
jgi:hypothetical protein